jgi:acetolactate synthase small subunit
MLQDPNVERYIEIAVNPLKKEIEQMKAQIEALNQALRIHDVVGRSEQLAEHECKFYVNADWTKLTCECGKQRMPEG